MIVVEQNLSRLIVFHDLSPIWPSQLKSKIFENKNVSKEISVEGKWYIGEEQKLKKIITRLKLILFTKGRKIVTKVDAPL